MLPARTLGLLALCTGALQVARAVPARGGAKPASATGSVFFKGGEYTLKLGVLDVRSVCWGSFSDGLLSTGWGELNIRCAGAADTVQHHAAGMLEGALTAPHIFDAYTNNLAFTFHGKPVPSAVTAFLETQDAWSRQQAAQHSGEAFWQHVASVTAQLDGLVEGYKLTLGHTHPIPLFGFRMLNTIGDLFQIIPAVVPSERPDWQSMNKTQMKQAMRAAGHCSALIKVTGDYSDLFMSHSSWFMYANTDRIFKHYNFAFSATSAAQKISFSSYPGYLYSLDDFYMMDSGLGMVQTSNNVFDNTLLDLIVPQSLLAWQRVRVASVMASSGEEWWRAFKTAASGTYVNQYMVVDFKKFTPQHALQPGTLWVVEEIPGLVAGADKTETLSRGYWPSYNVPYFPEVYNKSGYPQNDGTLGDDASYELAPRAKIFRRDQGTVKDMASYKRMMRYANYSDPYSISTSGKVDYGAAICMRGDLGADGHGGADGCYDTKVTSWRHGFFNLSCEAVNGPSSSASEPTSTNEPFSWRPSDAPASHVGLPPVYDFPFITIRAASL